MEPRIPRHKQSSESEVVYANISHDSPLHGSRSSSVLVSSGNASSIPPAANISTASTFSPPHVHVENAESAGHRPVSPMNSQHLLDTIRQKDSEIHLLRMNVTDKEVQIGRYGRDLDHCHHQMKHLNMLLSEKKENILSYQDQIANMRAELAQLRDETMAARAAGKQQGAPQDSITTNTQAEQALQLQVEQLSRQNTDLHRQVNDLRRNSNSSSSSSGERRPGPWPGAGPGGDDLKTKVEMLEVQVAIYKEDFLSERSDRERAQAELHAVKEERDNLKQAVNLLATEHGIRLDPAGLPLPPHS